MRLLLVEDDPYLQETLARSLSRRGMQVSCVGSPIQGGIKLRNEPMSGSVSGLNCEVQFKRAEPKTS